MTPQPSFDRKSVVRPGFKWDDPFLLDTSSTRMSA